MYFFNWHFLLTILKPIFIILYMLLLSINIFYVKHLMQVKPAAGETTLYFVTLRLTPPQLGELLYVFLSSCWACMSIKRVYRDTPLILSDISIIFIIILIMTLISLHKTTLHWYFLYKIILMIPVETRRGFIAFQPRAL